MCESLEAQLLLRYGSIERTHFKGNPDFYCVRAESCIYGEWRIQTTVAQTTSQHTHQQLRL